MKIVLEVNYPGQLKHQFINRLNSIIAVRCSETSLRLEYASYNPSLESLDSPAAT